MKESGTCFKFWTGHGGASGGSIAARALGSTRSIFSSELYHLSLVCGFSQLDKQLAVPVAGRLSGGSFGETVPLTVGLMQMWA